MSRVRPKSGPNLELQERQNEQARELMRAILTSEWAKTGAGMIVEMDGSKIELVDACRDILGPE